MPFIGQLFIQNASGEATFEPRPTNFDPNGVSGCPVISCTVKLTRASGKANYIGFVAIQKSILGDKDMILEKRDMSSSGVEEGKSYTDFTMLGEDETWWWGMSNALSYSGTSSYILLGLGLGRGDIGIEDDQYLLQWRCVHSNR